MAVPALQGHVRFEKLVGYLSHLLQIGGEVASEELRLTSDHEGTYLVLSPRVVKYLTPYVKPDAPAKVVPPKRSHRKKEES